jgi:hypothetical protein
MNLPKYARLEPRYEGELEGVFYSDDLRSSISVVLQRLEGGDLNLYFTRSGLAESRFTPQEMGKVLEVAQALFSQRTTQVPKRP